MCLAQIKVLFYVHAFVFPDCQTRSTKDMFGGIWLSERVKGPRVGQKRQLRDESNSKRLHKLEPNSEYESFRV